jgi:hypothetical protein
VCVFAWSPSRIRSRKRMSSSSPTTSTWASRPRSPLLAPRWQLARYSFVKDPPCV